MADPVLAFNSIEWIQRLLGSIRLGLPSYPAFNSIEWIHVYPFLKLPEPLYYTFNSIEWIQHLMEH